MPTSSIWPDRSSWRCARTDLLGGHEYPDACVARVATHVMARPTGFRRAVPIVGTGLHPCVRECCPPPHGRQPNGDDFDRLIATLTSPWLPPSTARGAQFEEATGVGFAPVSPTITSLPSPGSTWPGVTASRGGPPAPVALATRGTVVAIWLLLLLAAAGLRSALRLLAAALRARSLVGHSVSFSC